MNQSTDFSQLNEDARNVLARLEALWADEGVDQLSIFLDPDITEVLAEIKQLSLDFVRRVAELTS